MIQIPPTPRLFRGWYIALGGAASNFLIIGIATFGFGIFIRPMREELGWTVAAISLGVSLRSFEAGLMAPLSGFLMDRFGAHRLAAFGVLALGAGLAMFSQSYTLPMFYAASLLIALGQSTAGFTAFSAVVVAWFRKKRGRAIGIMNTGSGAGYLVTPLLAFLVISIGWRQSLLVCAVVIVAIALPLTRLLRGTPEDFGLLPDGEPPSEAGSGPPPAQTGMSVREALRTPAFYLLVLAGAANGPFGAWIVHQIPHLESVGFSTAQAAMLAGLYGVMQIGLRYVMGWWSDSMGRKRMYALSFLLEGVGLLVFANVTAERWWLLPLYYATFATGQALWGVLMVTAVADYFGTRRYASLRGLAQIMQTPVGVVAPTIAGLMFDRTGSYHLIFTIYAGVIATGAIWVMLIRRPTWVEFEAAQVEAAHAAPSSR